MSTQYFHIQDIPAIFKVTLNLIFPRTHDDPGSRYRLPTKIIPDTDGRVMVCQGQPSGVLNHKPFGQVANISVKRLDAPLLSDACDRPLQLVALLFLIPCRVCFLLGMQKPK